MHLVDLTHTFAEPMPGYPGDPPARLAVAADFHGCPLYEVTTGMHVGTHLDAPLHMLPDGASISELPLEKLTGPGVLIDARGATRIGPELLAGRELPRGAMVLVLTGWSAHFREPLYYEEYPEITPDFAQALVAAKVNLLALDTPSPDRPPYAIHHLLFQHGILIAENLTNLEALLGIDSFEVLALPAKFQAEAAPLRVIARVLAGVDNSHSKPTL